MFDLSCFVDFFRCLFVRNCIHSGNVCRVGGHGDALQACSEQVARMKAAQVLNPIFWNESFLVRAQNKWRV